MLQHYKRKRTWPRSLAMFVLGVLVGLVIVQGVIENRRQTIEEAGYCRMVAAGLWPDFKGTFADVCKGRKP